MASPLFAHVRRCLADFARNDLVGVVNSDTMNNWETCAVYARVLKRQDSLSTVLSLDNQYTRYRVIWLRYAEALLPTLEQQMKLDTRLVLNYLCSFPRPSRGRKHVVPVSNPLYQAWLALCGRNPLSVRGQVSRMRYTEQKRGRSGVLALAPDCPGMLYPEECGA